MIQTIKKNITLVVAAIVLAAGTALLATPTLAGAQEANIQNNLCAGTNLTWSSDPAECDTAGSTDNVNNMVTTIVNIFSWVVGVVAVIMIIVGGFKYITSNGDSNNVTGAKNTIMYAIIGLIIVALAQIIVRFVLNTAGVGA